MRYICLLSSVALVASAQHPLPDRSPAPRWQKTVSRDGAFSFSMPGTPSFKTQPITAKNGRPVQYSTYTIDRDARAYMVSYSDYDIHTTISLDGATEGILSTWKDPHIKSRSNTTIFGHPAQLIRFPADGG